MPVWWRIPEFGGYSVPEEYGAFLMDKSWRMKSSVQEQRYGQWEVKQRKYQPLTEQTEQQPIRRHLGRMA